MIPVHTRRHIFCHVVLHAHLAVESQEDHGENNRIHSQHEYHSAPKHPRLLHKPRFRNPNPNHRVTCVTIERQKVKLAVGIFPRFQVKKRKKDMWVGRKSPLVGDYASSGSLNFDFTLAFQCVLVVPVISKELCSSSCVFALVTGDYKCAVA